MFRAGLIKVPSGWRCLNGVPRSTTALRFVTNDATETSKLGFKDVYESLGRVPRPRNSRKSVPEPLFDTRKARVKPPSGPFEVYRGRTKDVKDGDIAGAFKSLNITLKNNSVAKHYKTQKFYEKPSDKRVRLNRERHRKRFLSGVKRLVNLVKEQRKFN